MTSEEAAKFTGVLYLIRTSHEFAKDATYLARKPAFLSKKAGEIMKQLETKLNPTKK